MWTGLCIPATVPPPHFPIARPDLIVINTNLTSLTLFSLLSRPSGYPALSIPCGMTKGKPPLPVGLQLVARPHQEMRLLQLAAAFEAAHSYHQLVPRDPVRGALP
jgi:aspartyl-tRNA(Asn)/glutamyl-tRNA(Gln) amidotransferase subunit A